VAEAAGSVVVGVAVSGDVEVMVGRWKAL
jgi:hypothetical protein